MCSVIFADKLVRNPSRELPKKGTERATKSVEIARADLIMIG